MRPQKTFQIPEYAHKSKFNKPSDTIILIMTLEGDSLNRNSLVLDVHVNKKWSSEHSVILSMTPCRKFWHLHFCLLSSIILSTDGKPTTSRNACLEFWRKNFCLEKIYMRRYRDTVCPFMPNLQVISPHHQSRRMWLTGKRFCESRKQYYVSYPENRGSFRLQLHITVETDNWNTLLGVSQ